MRVAEPGQHPGLAVEPLGERGRSRRFRPEDLQRHQPVEPRLPGLVDGAHAAVAQQLQDFELREMGGQPAGSGGTKPDEPGSGAVGSPSAGAAWTPVSLARPAAIKHLGQIPAGASAGNSVPQRGRSNGRHHSRIAAAKRESRGVGVAVGVGVAEPVHAEIAAPLRQVVAIRVAVLT